MADNQPGHQEQIKQANLGILYRLIDQAGPLSRIDLSRLTQLAPASMTKLCRDMLKARLVKETVMAGSGHRGRPAVGLKINGDSWYYLSVRIAHGQLCMAIYNMACQCCRADRVSLPAEADTPLEQRILQHIQCFFRQLSADEWPLVTPSASKVPLNLAAISVTLPGMVDSNNGIIRQMTGYPVRDMPLGALLQHHCQLPVYIQHDLSAWIMSETLFGAARGARDVVLMVISDHVGASVISEGHLLHAESSSLVELGHIQVEPDGARCRCGGRGCLETLISTGRILSRWHTLRQQPACRPPLSVEDFCDAALAGDALAQQLLFDVAAHAGQALAMMVNVFHPQKILLGSPFNRAAALLFPAINQVIHQQAWTGYRPHSRLESTGFTCFDTMPGSAEVKNAMYDGTLLMRLLS